MATAAYSSVTLTVLYNVQRMLCLGMRQSLAPSSTFRTLGLSCVKVISSRQLWDALWDKCDAYKVTGLTRATTTQDDAIERLDVKKPLDTLPKLDRATFNVIPSNGVISTGRQTCAVTLVSTCAPRLPAKAELLQCSSCKAR
ncbi:hypothetical protein WJX77_002779 [Trebouxia sp. C0004]